MKDAPFKSTFALLDVKQGRHALAKKIEAGERVRVLVDLEINTKWSQDDGISIEFSGDVLSIKQFEE